MIDNYKQKFNHKEMRNHLLFCYFSYSMKGKIYRVTYNVGNGVAELHMDNGEVKTVSIPKEEWDKMIQGNVVENFNKFLNE